MRRHAADYADTSRLVHTARALALLGVVLAVGLSAATAVGQRPQWIWSPQHPAGRVPTTSCYFRKEFPGDGAAGARLIIAADDTYEVFINGRKIAEGSGWEKSKAYRISNYVKPGGNTLAIKVTNTAGRTAGLAARVEITRQNNQKVIYATDSSWRTSLQPLSFWHLPIYRDSRWPAAQTMGPQGTTEPWITGEESADESLAADQSEPSLDAAQAARPSSAAAQEMAATEAVATDESAGTAAATTAVEETAARQPAVAGEPLFRTQKGFQVQLLAAHDQTGSLIAAEFNEFRELLLSQENGPLLLMTDTDDDQLLDTPRVYCDEVKNVQGILPLNGDVYVTGHGPQGVALYRLQDADRDGNLEVTDTLIKFKAIEGLDDDQLGEHGPHGLALGLDGQIYVAVGNHALVEGGISSDSPYRNFYEGDIVPRFEDPGGHAVGVKAPGGTIVRVPVAGGSVERVAGGLRNVYDLAFDQWGNLLTHDSDMEADEGTSWYRPTRISHIVPGGEYGWRSGWAKWPDYWHDSLPPTLSTGRGSPTGVVVYDHFMFPERFHDNLLACDWTNGRLLHVKTQSDGATFKAASEILVQGEPLNITDLTVGPDGWVYFVTGGRETAGGVYRLVYTGDTPDVAKKVGTGIPAAIRHPQFQSAWARQAVAKIKQDDPARWEAVMPAVARTERNVDRFRTRALDLMLLYGPSVSGKLLLQLSKDESPRVRAKVADLMGLGDKRQFGKRLIEMLGDEDAAVRRRACEAIVRTGATPQLAQLKPLLTSTDRYEAAAARRVLERVPTAGWRNIVLGTQDHRLFIEGATALLIAQPNKATALKVLARFEELLPAYITDQNFRDMLRLAQIAVERGAIERADIPALTRKLGEEFPSADTRMNRELLRLLVRLQVTTISDRYVRYLQSDLDDVDRLQAALHLALLKHAWTSDQRFTLLKTLEEALAARGGSSHNGYVQNVTRRFAGQLSDKEKRQVLAQAGEMPNAALAVLFHLPDQVDGLTLASLRELYPTLQKNPSPAAEQLKIGIIAVLGESGGAEAMDFLRQQYSSDPELRGYISMALAQQPEGANWAPLIDSLQLADSMSGPMILKALAQVDRAPDESAAYRHAIVLGLKLGEGGGNDALALLQHWTGERPAAAAEKFEDRIAVWQTWFTERWPDEPKPALPAAQTESRWDFEELLAHLHSSEAAETGSPERGAAVFEKGQCAKCHRYGDTGDTIGPDLTNLVRRFRKREMLESIIYPSYVISDQYRSQTVITAAGRQLTGIVASGAPGEVVVLQQDGKKVIVKKDDVDETIPSKISVMPEGLLNTLTLQEITDLFAYLTSPTEATTAAKPER